MQARKTKGAVPFIIKNEHTNKYELTKQAQDLLKKVDKNISVVSVAGLYRTGKSYLLNSVILDKKSIFGVGPTVNPCTKGLWMWVEPDPISEKRSMIVIDTQGLGALDEESNHDVKIFCLAVLLSTTFIYNSVGSIDQNALQTLSLVLNLVSNIDQENGSNRPQFIWVVRDFSLQLIDDKGKILTPHQYLQMALTTNTKQQQKMSIRKTITTAFSQRDCFTLVKPLIDQNKLQNLDQIPMDELRPQFVSQSIQLRNKIKSTLKEFKLTSNHNNITGKQYVMVVQKYLTAINSGAVPNMVDTWTFIKEEKCREALQQITRTYTEKIKSKVIPKIPMKRTHLDEQFKAMKTEMKALFLKMTYGQSSTESIDQFISNVYTQAVKLNSDETKLWMKGILNKQFEPFLKKLYSQQYYNNFNEFQAQISKNYRQALVQKLTERVDDIKQQVDRFVDQKLVENFKFFEKKLKDDVKNAQAMKDELECSLNRQISQINALKQKERRSQQEKIYDLEKKIRTYENEKQQMMQYGKAEKDLIESNIKLLKKKNQQLVSTNQDLSRQISKLNTTQNQLKQKNFIQNKQNQKQRALFAQKEEYMTTKIKELEQKCFDFQGKLNQVGGKLELQKRDLSRHLQSKIQTLESQNKRLSEKLIESEAKFGKILDEAKQLSDQMQNLKQNSVSQKKKLEQKLIEVESNKKPSKIEHELKQQNHDLILQNQKMGEKVNDLNKRMKILQEEMKNMQNNGQKQIAIHVQQIQFQQIQISDLKNRYEELKKSYQHTLENMHDSSKSQESNMQLKIYELTAEHQKDIKNLQAQYEEKLKSCKKQIQMLTRHKEEIALQQSLEKKNLQSKQKQWKESTSMLHLMVKKLQQKIQSSEKDHEDINKEKETFYSMRIKQLEQEVEEVKQKSTQELSDNAKKSQEAIAVLKHYSQIEKQQWEKRLIDQKDRNEKKIKSLKDEHEKKLNEERSNFEEQISDLQSRLVHMERVFNEKLQNMQYDHGIAIQKITNQYMQEKVQINKQLALTQQKLEMTRVSFEKELSNKIKYYEATLESTKASLRQQFQETIKRLTEQKQILQQKFDTTKKANRQLEQSNLILKSQGDKQRAVHKQKQKSLETKIVEIQNRFQYELSNYNKTIEGINQRHALEIEKLNEQIDKLNISVANLQEEKDKIQTENENNINRLQAKLKVVEESKNKNKQDYEDIVNKFQNAVSHFGTQKKKIILQKQKGMEEMTEKTSYVIKQIEQSHAKMIKQHEDRITRLITENKSLKQRMMVMQLQRSAPTPKKNYMDQAQKQKLDRKYEKRIEQYKQMYERQKQKSRKLKQQNTRLRMQNESSSFIQGTSTMTYQRPSFSEVSNSRLYNAPSNNTMFNNPTEVKRKYTNTPSGSQRSGTGLEQYSGFMKFNGGTGYKNRD